MIDDDNWSLKGKEIRVFVEYGDGVDDMYRKMDIETLRKKLLEDKEKLQHSMLNRVTAYITFPLKADKETRKMIVDISSIINEEFHKYEEVLNRRFGVESNMSKDAKEAIK